jgi:hypothetical protein
MVFEIQQSSTCAQDGRRSRDAILNAGRAHRTAMIAS